MSWLHERARMRWTVAAAVMLMLASFAVVLPADSARAADPNWSQSPVSSAYGMSWGTAYIIPTAGGGCWTAKAKVRYSGSTSGSYWAELNTTACHVYVESSFNGTAALPLPVGSYEFVVEIYSEGWDGVMQTTPGYISPPLQVTVTKSSLATSVSVTADPANPKGAVISLATSSAFVDELTGYGVGSFPAGKWTVTATERDGETVLESEFPQAAGGLPVFNTYWSGVPEGAVFDVSAIYSVGAAESGGFTVSGGSASFTSPAAESPTASPTPLPTPEPDAEAEESGAVVPLWALLLLALAALAMVAAIAVVAVRARMGRKPAALVDAKEDDVVVS